jgi:S-DNA-T family DNA segregation ATPase FtsK/SpoIIIE
VVVTGPPGSGRSTALRTLVHAIHLASPGVGTAYLGVRRPSISVPDGWSRAACGDDVGELAGRISDEIDAGSLPERLVVIEALEDLVGDSEDELRRLLRSARAAGVCVLIEGELSLLSQSYGIAKEARASRQALVLQPDSSDLEVMSGYPSGRLDPAAFPPGRGFWCGPSGYTLVQVAVT